MKKSNNHGQSWTIMDNHGQWWTILTVCFLGSSWILSPLSLLFRFPMRDKSEINAVVRFENVNSGSRKKNQTPWVKSVHKKGNEELFAGGGGGLGRLPNIKRCRRTQTLRKTWYRVGKIWEGKKTTGCEGENSAVRRSGVNGKKTRHDAKKKLIPSCMAKHDSPTARARSSTDAGGCRLY